MKRDSKNYSTDMLSEFALSPAVFRLASYESNAVADVCLGSMRGPFFEDCVVRDLRQGQWSECLYQERDVLHPRAKELLKKLRAQKRLVPYELAEGEGPREDQGWETEAIRTHATDPLAGMIFSREAKEIRHADNPAITCPERLATTAFWTNRPCSLRIPRSMGEYSLLLAPILRHSNFIAFIDPHLDPSETRYKDFLQLLVHPIVKQRKYPPKIEVHRVAWLGNGQDKTPRLAQIEKIFRDAWSATLAANRLGVEVFLWDDMHDRYVCSNHLGLAWTNGFDCTRDTNARVTVARLRREDRDDLQREFDANSTRHALRHRFEIGS